MMKDLESDRLLLMPFTSYPCFFFFNECVACNVKKNKKLLDLHVIGDAWFLWA